MCYQLVVQIKLTEECLRIDVTLEPSSDLAWQYVIEFVIGCDEAVTLILKSTPDLAFKLNIFDLSKQNCG